MLTVSHGFGNCRKLFLQNVDTQATLDYNRTVQTTFEPTSNPEIADLGEKLRELRARSGWTLDELARQTSLSKSYLSRLEDGDRQPSLAALLSISRAFGVSLAALFEGEPSRRDDVVTWAEQTRPQPGNGLVYRALSSAARPVSMQPVRVTVPFARTGTERYQHDGEEWLYVLSGTLQLTLTNDTFTLSPGDAAHFDAREPHRLTAMGGADVELILVACAAPRNLLDSYL